MEAKKDVANAPLLAALKLALGAVGVVGDETDWWGWTGAAFRCYWTRLPLWCPSNLQRCETPFYLWLSEAIGHRVEPCLNWEWEPFQARVRESTRRGLPVVVSGLWGGLEWSVVWKAEEAWHLSLGDGSEECLWEPRGGWKGYLFGPASLGLWGQHPALFLGEPCPSPKRALLNRRALEAAERLAEPGQEGFCAKGLLAYEAWATALRDHREFADSHPKEMERRAWMNAALLGTLMDERQRAARFLRRMAAEAPWAIARLLEDAGRHYEEAAHCLADARRVLPYPLEGPAEQALQQAVEALADRERREAAAESLLAARAMEASAIHQIRRVLQQWPP